MRPVDALYENGLLRPVSPLPLRSGERVALIVIRRPDPRRWDFTRLAAHGDDDLARQKPALMSGPPPLIARTGGETWRNLVDRSWGLPDEGANWSTSRHCVAERHV